MNFVSGGEDKNLVIFENSEIQERILHSSTLWAVTVDYATGDV